MRPKPQTMKWSVSSSSMRSRRRRTQRLSRSPSTSASHQERERVEHGAHAHREHDHREELAPPRQRVDFLVPGRRHRDDRHVQGVPRAPPLDQHVADRAAEHDQRRGGRATGAGRPADDPSAAAAAARARPWSARTCGAASRPMRPLRTPGCRLRPQEVASLLCLLPVAEVDDQPDAPASRPAAASWSSRGRRSSRRRPRCRGSPRPAAPAP